MQLFNFQLPTRVVRKETPYFSQWESPNLVGDILSGKLKAQDDPKWRESGAADADEYALWSWAACGMACTKMILAAQQKGEQPLVDLAKRALKHGAYKEPFESSPGMFYRPYVDFIKQEFGMHAQVTGRLTIGKIMRALAGSKYVIASVSPDIRNPQSTPAKKGGHLVLVVGYDRARRELYIHNPSGNTAASQAFAVVSFDEFEKFSARRGIVLS